MILPVSVIGLFLSFASLATHATPPPVPESDAGRVNTGDTFEILDLPGYYSPQPIVSNVDIPLDGRGRNTDPNVVALEFLAGQLRLDVSDMQVEDSFSTPHNGVRHVHVIQLLKGQKVREFFWDQPDSGLRNLSSKLPKKKKLVSFSLSPKIFTTTPC